MEQFTTFDIFQNLLLAARWTVLLSIIAFIGGGIVAGVLLILRMTNNKFLTILIQIYVEVFKELPFLCNFSLHFLVYH